MPNIVYVHAEGQTHPWTWALIHGGFILAQCAALIYFGESTNWPAVKPCKVRRPHTVDHRNRLDAVVTTTASGIITDWNTQAEIMFDVPRTKAIGQPLTTYPSPVILHRGECR